MRRDLTTRSIFFANERQIRDWPIAGEFFFSSGEMMDSFRVA